MTEQTTAEQPNEIQEQPFAAEQATENPTPPATEEEPVSLLGEYQKKADKGIPDDVPEEFWDDEKNTINHDKVFEDWKQKSKIAKDLRSKLGRGEQKTPESAEDYKITFEGLEQEKVSEINMDGDAVEALNKIAHAEGFSQDQYDRFMSKAIPAIHELAKQKIGQEGEAKELSAEEVAAQSKAFYEAQREKLGPAPERVLSAVSNFMKPIEAEGVLSESAKQLYNEFVSHADGVQILNALRAQYMGDTFDRQEAASTSFGWQRDNESQLRDLILDQDKRGDPAHERKINEMMDRRAKFNISGPLKL